LAKAFGAHGFFPHDIIPLRSRDFASGRFGRLFGSLPPFASDSPQTRQALLDIGKPGGIMDARDNLTVGPKLLITDPTLSRNNPDNLHLTAGMTFLGQFVDHDISFDPTSSLTRQSDPEMIKNFRDPTLGLDNLYGSGPGASPHLYDQQNGGGIKFLIEESGTPGKFDVPRNSQKIAIIGDPRNDENLVVSQLHLAFLRFHNAVVDYVHQELKVTDFTEAFNEAQRFVRWHYQWMIVHEFLRLTCGEKVVGDVITNGRKFYHWRNNAFIPVEFSVACYRFGHSQVRPSYRANFSGDNGQPFFAFIFDPNGPGNPADPVDLSGSARAPRRFIDWPTFFDFNDNEVKHNKKIDPVLSTPLFSLPGTVVVHPNPLDNPRSLAQRNLLRALTFSLPSGQRVAQAMQIPPLNDDDLDMLKPYDLANCAPLWFYILREAQLTQSGEMLGPVAARIVTEVFIGLLQADKMSYLSQEPDWRPFLPTVDRAQQGKDYKMVDILRFAGVA
jgi:hypothetical protein